MEEDVIWCEEVTAGEECEWEAEPKTNPPRCKEHAKKKRALKSVPRADRPKCPDITANHFPCRASADPKREDGRCAVHGRRVDGLPIGNPDSKCEGLRYDKRCTLYPIKGTRFCSAHSDPDPAVRARTKAEALAKRETGNDRYADLLTGKLAVEALTDEELARGWPIPSNGDRSGRPPSKIPMAVHKRCVQELFKRADDALRASLMGAVGVMETLMLSEDATPADRIKAATWIYERVRGKIPDVVQHVQEKPFETIFTKVEAGVRKVSSERTSGALAIESFVDAEEAGEDE